MQQHWLAGRPHGADTRPALCCSLPACRTCLPARNGAVGPPSGCPQPTSPPPQPPARPAGGLLQFNLPPAPFSPLRPARYRDPSLPIHRTEITRFPHAVLEIKLALPDGEQPPEWVRDLMDSGLITEVGGAFRVPPC